MPRHIRLKTPPATGGGGFGPDGDYYGAPHSLWWKSILPWFLPALLGSALGAIVITILVEGK